MSAAAISKLPTLALAALFAHAGRGLLWVAAKAVRAPVATLILMGGAYGGATAANNALFGQHGQHPSPFFTDHAMVTAAVPEMVPQKIVAQPEPVLQKPAPLDTRATRSASIVTPPSPSQTATIPHIRTEREIGNADIMAMQKNLAKLGYYEGDADGYYGPKTAAAIRAFEAANNLPQIGAVTPELIDAVLKVQSGSGDRAATLQLKSQRSDEPMSRSVPTIENLVADLSGADANAGAQMADAASKAQNHRDENLQKALPPDNIARIVEQVAARNTSESTKAPAKPSVLDGGYITKVQLGLSSLGFLQGKIDGVAGEDTSRAIRNFEVYYNYKVTGEVTPELLDLLTQAGAQI